MPSTVTNINLIYRGNDTRYGQSYICRYVSDAVQDRESWSQWNTNRKRDLLHAMPTNQQEA